MQSRSRPRSPDPGRSAPPRRWYSPWPRSPALPERPLWRSALFPWRRSMDLTPLGLAIHVCGAVFFIFGVGKIIDHLAQGLRVGRRGIGLQIDFGHIEPVEAVLENLVQRIGIAGCEPAQLAVIQHPRDLAAESVPLRLGLEGRGQLPRPLMVQDTRNLVCEAVGTVKPRRIVSAGGKYFVTRANPKPLAQLVVAANLIDGLRVADLDDGRIGRAKP